MKPPFNVVVVGNAGIDTNVYGSGVDFSVESHFTENIDCLGQAGGYAARGYARLGRSTAFIGHVGDDFAGRFVLGEFARDGIDTSAVFPDPAGTSRSINFMFPDGRRKNFYDGKSHMTLRPDLDRCRSVLAGATLAHFNIPNWARYLLPIARQLGLAIACDIQDVVCPDDPYRQDFIHAADFLFFSSTNHPDPSPLIHHFLHTQPRQIIIAGMGDRGCALGTSAGIEFFPPVSMDRPVIDTNGAGDSLAVGFLSSYVFEKRSLPDSIRRGQIAARFACSLKASSSSLITPDQMAHYTNP